MDHEFYIGPWQLATGEKAGGFGRLWHPPAGSVGNLCLRGSLRNDEAGPGLFVMPRGVHLPSPYEHLGSGDPRSIMPGGRVRIAFEALSGKTATGTSLAEWMRGAIGIHADMSGIGPAPLRPRRDRATKQPRLGFWLAGERLMDVPFDLNTDEGARARLRMQEAYRKVRTQARDGKMTVRGVADPEFHRRLLSAWGEQYKVNNPEDVWIPADLPRETRLRHGTTLTDDFNRANSSTSPGSSSEGWSWVEEVEALGISSNQIYNTGAGFSNACARADSALGSDDHYAQIQRTDTSSGQYVGPCIRFESGAARYYVAAFRDSSSGLYRRIDGSFSLLVGLTAELATNTYKLDMAGNDLEAFINGVSDATYTDTDATLDGNLYTGCSLRLGTNTGDDFKASDGLGGGPTFTQAVSGSITPTGALTSRMIFAEAVAGSTTPTGALLKKISFSLASSMTPSGALTKRVQKTLQGSVTMTSALVKKAKVVLAGSITAAGDLHITWKQDVAGSSTPSGALSSVLNVGGTVRRAFIMLFRRRRGGP